ncbi:MAG: hypothetical protein HQL52_20220 [Magnetococcales bacterium]|nr:hypothetical protein [Magnetococcales bacterium]
MNKTIQISQLENDPLDALGSAHSVVEALSALLCGQDDLHHINETATSGVFIILSSVSDTLKQAKTQFQSDWQKKPDHELTT